MKIALDSSVLIQYISMGCENHSLTRQACARYRAQGAEFVLAEHTILEAFSVLSRSPLPIGIPPRDAEQALRRNFGSASVAPIRQGLAWEAIRHTMERGHWGGRIYDTAIALAAYQAGARVLLTWNLRHFVTIAPPGLDVLEPA